MPLQKTARQRGVESGVQHAHRANLCSPCQGRLTGLGGEDLPTIVIVAHYDSFGVAPVSSRWQKPCHVWALLSCSGSWNSLGFGFKLWFRFWDITCFRECRIAWIGCRLDVFGLPLPSFFAHFLCSLGLIGFVNQLQYLWRARRGLPRV